MYDLIIIGGGPGGVAAGVYASRKQLKTLFITKEWGGQSTVSAEIQNWIGTKVISGTDFATNLKEHLQAYAGEWVEIIENQLVTRVEKTPEGCSVTLQNGNSFTARALLVTTGSTRRKLTVPGAEAYENKGITYCASCDGPLFSGQDVIVIGGGNAGFESAAQLLAYAKSVTLLHHGTAFKADPVTVEKVLAHPNMTGIAGAETKEIRGGTFVQELIYEKEGVEYTLPVQGVFVEIGLVPSTQFMNTLVETDAIGRIAIDPWTQQTSVPGIWAAGDCTNIKYHQNNISAGDAVRALEDIYVHLKTK